MDVNIRSAPTRSLAPMPAPGLHIIRPHTTATPTTRRPLRVRRDLVTIDELPDYITGPDSENMITSTNQPAVALPRQSPVTGVKRSRSEAQLSPPRSGDLATTTTGPTIPGLFPVRAHQILPPVPVTSGTADLMNLAMTAISPQEYLSTVGASSIPPRPLHRIFVFILSVENIH